jgi:hypothetical protein
MEGPDPVVTLALCIRRFVRVGAREPILRHVEPTQAVGQIGCVPRLTKTFETLTTEALGVGHASTSAEYVDSKILKGCKIIVFNLSVSFEKLAARGGQPDW